MVKRTGVATSLDRVWPAAWTPPLPWATRFLGPAHRMCFRWAERVTLSPRHRLLTTAALFAAFAVTGCEKDEAVLGPGTYETNLGTMQITPQGKGPLGTYQLGDGLIYGSVSATQLSGLWVQSNGDEPCAQSVYDSRFWGRIKLRFSADFSVFEGSLRHCDGHHELTLTGHRRR